MELEQFIVSPQDIQGVLRSLDRTQEDFDRELQERGSVELNRHVVVRVTRQEDGQYLFTSLSE